MLNTSILLNSTLRSIYIYIDYGFNLPKYTSFFPFQRSGHDKLDESLAAVGMQHKMELEASPEHLGVKGRDLFNHVTELKQDDSPEMAESNAHHINIIPQQHSSQPASFLGQREQLVPYQLQQPKEEEEQSVPDLSPIRVRVFVHVSNGSTASILVNIVVATVGDVKLRVDSSAGIKPSCQRVMFYDVELKDDSQTLYSAGTYVEWWLLV